MTQFTEKSRSSTLNVATEMTQFTEKSRSSTLNVATEMTQFTEKSRSSTLNVATEMTQFRETTKARPNYACTVCHRLLFPDQVRLCDHKSYQKNPMMTSSCLTGKFLHTCSSDCSDNCAPEEMKNEWICHSCHDNLSKGRMPSIASANKLQLAPIPAELCDLNILERHVISKYVCFAKVISLPKGQQRAIKGAVVSVPSDVETTVNVLPRPSGESQLLTVKLKRRLCYSGHYQFQTISMQKVLSALLKLKEIHSEYRDIVINNVEQDELFDDFPDPINEYDIPEDEMENDNTDNDESVDFSALDWSEKCEILRSNPVTAMRMFEKRVEALMNLIHSPAQPIGHVEDSFYRVEFQQRGSPHIHCLFWVKGAPEFENDQDQDVCDFIDRHISCKLPDPNTDPELNRIVSEVQTHSRNHSKSCKKNNKHCRFGFPKPPMKKTLRDLFAMLRQLGTPTFFCTFSAAEMRWPEVITAIKAQQGESVDFSALDWSEKCEILRSNPVTAMRMFEKRVEALMNLIQSPAQPIGHVVDFFYRVEFQQRGSPHIHCLFWVNGAPEFENDQDQDVCDFIDRHISCKLPDPNTDPELNRIVSEVQTHSRNHSKSCKKNNKHCRFGFPKPPMKKTLRDLFAMLRQLGTPTFFCTFSAAEMRWPEVITAIKAQQGESVDFSALDWSEKCEILRSNPVTAMRMFEKRVEALMNLIQSPAQPIGHVVDFFYRVEFQQRGSPHIHCLFWVNGAPEFENDQDQDVCDFIDRHISCKLPDPNTDPELHRTVSEVQTHSRNHSKSCKKNNKHCRFGFPKPPMKNTLITRPRPPPDTDSDDEGAEKDEPVTQAKSKLQPVWDLLNDKTQNFESITQLLETVNMMYEEYKDNVNSLSSASVVIMQREPNDCWVNGYNPLLLRAWDANMDIQFILNPYTCIMYILSYISKGEHEMSEYLKGVIKEMCPNTSERESMKQVMHAYAKNREVSAQEAVARTCSLKLKSSSRAVIFIPTDDNTVKMSLPMSCLQDKAPDDENVWMTGLAEKYMARPETPEFENMCMAEFASEYRIVYGDQRKGKNVIPLQNDMGHIKKRTRGKPAIIRFARFSQQKHPEKFYATLLKLYLPHRSSSQLKTAQFNTHEAFYAFASVKLPGTDTLQRVYTTVNENRKKYEKHSEAIDKAIENFEQNGPIEDAWTNLAPTNELIRLECMIEQEPTDPTDITEADDVPDFAPSTSENRTAMPVIEAPQVNPAVIRKMYQSLNETQAAVFYEIRDWCKRKVQNENPEPFFYYVAGTAGTGKSHLIKSVYAEATKILQKLPCVREEADMSKPTVLLSAFTGCASHNINGKTLHALLKLPRSLKPPYQGLGNSLDEIRANFSNLQIMIIDEISMVSKPLFAYVNWRLQQIKGNNKPFGNISIMAVGDFQQLPPLGKAKPLCVYEDHVLDFWRDHFKMITLTEIMRQKDDLAFAELLNRLRVKQKHEALTDADRRMLEQVIKPIENCPPEALHIFPTNKEVDDFNSAAITSRFSDITKIDAEDYKKDPRSGQMQRQGAPFKGEKGDLMDTLQVAVGARVMLTRNIDVESGLVNGSFGKVAKIITQTRNSVPVVQKIGVELDNADAGRKHRSEVPGETDNFVYIEREEESLKKKGTVRRQFPMKLAFACTAHKVQGMTTHSAVVSLKKIFEPGMAYVALSRTTSLSGLNIIDFDEKKIFCDPEISTALENMPKADLHTVQPLLQTIRESNLNQAITIVHHNTEGLQHHFKDIKSHHELLLSDVLCLTETHLTGSAVPDCLQLEGYRMHQRNRHVSYTNFTHLSNKSGGGVAIYVKNHLQARLVQYVQNVTDLEFLLLKVEAPKQVVIAVVYRPPNYRLSDFMPNLDALLTFLEIMDYKPAVVCGDFNEDQLSKINKPVLNLFQSKGFTQIINHATTEKNTLLDPVFISNPNMSVASGILNTYYSYHNPVYCVV
uniref:ATP-dependent DNA helicase n=1 Tax=Astyanax mexicanus TaxID=7994 RepID=A0A3B1IIS5_ASTMX